MYISLTKDLSLLLHAIHNLSTSTVLADFKETYSTLVLKTHTKNAKQENSSLFVNSIL
jgi:hypothetical protein